MLFIAAIFCAIC